MILGGRLPGKVGRRRILYSSLAQSVERMTVNHDVAGSSPAGGAKKKDIFGCLFSVIFVPCGTSDIYFVSDIALRAVIFAYGELKEQI